ncbi:MAG: nuclear transport factor 2 family protein [Bacteroidota bacterium]
MKTTISIGFFLALFSTMSFAQKAEIMAVKKTITTFSKAGDNNDATALASVLDNNYRVIMNRLFGSKEVSIMPREVYLEKIRTKEFGGDSRKVSFESVLINGNTATAKVNFKGQKLSMHSLITLVQDEEGDWKLISDVPVVL